MSVEILVQNELEITVKKTDSTPVIVEVENNSPMVVEVEAVGVQGIAPFYEHIQSSALSTWVVAHNLGFKPSVEVFDVGGKVVEAEINHISINLTNILFVLPTTGSARFN